MTLFETLPQLTMFVLFFMLGFASRFVARSVMFGGTIACGKIEKRLLGNDVKGKHHAKNSGKHSEKVVRKDSQNDVENDSIKMNIFNRTSKMLAQIFSKVLSFRKFSFKKLCYKTFILIKNVTACLFEALFFVLLGIATLYLFNIFKFVDFYWFIPLSVICGVLIEDYLTKELFAKRKKM